MSSADGRSTTENNPRAVEDRIKLACKQYVALYMQRRTTGGTATEKHEVEDRERPSRQHGPEYDGGAPKCNFLGGEHFLWAFLKAGCYGVFATYQ